MREKSRPGYNPATVAENNVRRDSWNNRYSSSYGPGFDEDMGDYDPGDSEYWDSKDYGNS